MTPLPRLDGGASTDPATHSSATEAGALGPAVRYVGRFDTSDPAGPIVDWSGGRIVARFDGTEVSATLTDTSYGGGNAFWDVTIDGVLRKMPLGLTEGTATYSLVTGLPSGPHSVELWKRTEANVSSTQFGGFSFGGGTLLAPPPAASRRIEFLGDSVSVGFGDEGVDPACTFSPATENDHLAFPGRVATALRADHHNVSYSGRGVYWNFDRSDPVVFAQLYVRTRALVATPGWSFSSFVPDVVWITLGGNDWDQPNPGDPPPPLPAFEAAYDELYQTVRGNYPEAFIVCAIAPSLNDNYPSDPPYQALTSMRTALADILSLHPTDTKLASFEFARATAASLSGCGFHPDLADQAALATQATAFIQQHLGWH